MSLHIRILAGSLAPTAGSHIYNAELARRLAARGHRVSVVAFDRGTGDWGDVEVIALPRHDWSSLPAAWRFATPLQATLSRLQIATAPLDRPDVVIAAEHLFLRPHARRFAGVPWLYLPHSLTVGHEIDSYDVSGLQRRLMRRFYVKQQSWALRHAAVVVRFNQTAAEALTEDYGDATIRAPFLVNAPGIDLPAAGARAPRAAGAPLRLLFVGRLVPSKSLGLVLSSLAEHSERAWFLDVLGDGPERPSLEAEARGLGLAEKVRFLGRQDPAAWYCEADLLVFPSRLESMGLVVLEAMAHGVPALVVREDGANYRVPFSEVVEDGVTGLLARDEDDFRARLAQTIADPIRLGPMSDNARAHIAARFCWNRHLDGYEAEFARLMRAARTASVN